MNKLGQFITTVVIGGFAIFLAALIALSMSKDSADGEITSTLSETLTDYPKNLNFAALIVPDVYGSDQVGGLVVCPGTSEKDLSEAQVDTADIEFEDGKVADDVNYFVTVSTEQEYHAEKLQRSTSICVMSCSSRLKQRRHRGRTCRLCTRSSRTRRCSSSAPRRMTTAPTGTSWANEGSRTRHRHD